MSASESPPTRDQLLDKLAQLETRVREAERLAEILEGSSQAFAVGTTAGVLTRVNHAFCELTGYSEQELLSDVTWNETLTPPEWRAHEGVFLDKVIRTGGPERFKKQYLHKGGGLLTVELLVQLAPDDPTQVYAFVTDISARARLEQERAKTEARYRGLIENLSSGVVHVSVTGEVTLANTEAQRVLGLSYDRMTERFVNDWEGETLREDGTVCPVADYPVSRCLMTGEAQSGEIVGVRRPDGETSWALFSAHPEFDEGKLTGAVVSFRDISEWRRAEESVRLLSSTIEQSPVSVMMTDRHGTIVYVNPAFTESTGYTAVDIVGQSPRILQSGVHPPAFYKDLWDTVLAGDVWRKDICNRNKQGDLYWELTSIGPVRSLDGEIHHLVAMKVDDTERRQAVEALRQSEELFRIVTQTANDPIIAMDSDDRITVWNPAAQQVFGYTDQQALGRSPTQLRIFPGDVLSQSESAEQPGRGRTIETLAHRNDGTEFPAEVSVAFVQRGDVWNRTAIVRDTTERKRLERELLRISKLESVAVLAGGIAHDFNNILTGILANISLASRKLDADSRSHELLDAAMGAAQRATGLTRQLLTFAKGGTPIKTIMSVRDLGQSAEFVLRGSNVRCDAHFPDDLWLVNADAGQLDQVIQNLVINADHAMPNGGVIRIDACNRVLEAGEVPPLPPAAYIELTVTDQGNGIPREHIDKIFDPYFSTKQRGSGLGLATAFAVIKNHHGHLTVSSEPGSGSTFTAFIPASRTATAHPDPALPAENATAAGRILIMDDDAMVRRVAAMTLGELGYDVDVAQEGTAAIALYQAALSEDRRYDAVIIDLTVPGGMGGLATLAGLQAVDPQVDAIVSSGYSDDPAMTDPSRFGFRGCVTKPFTLEELAAAVKDCGDKQRR